MSFLVGDDDPSVVEEALAFIDSCGTEEAAILSSSYSEDAVIQARGDADAYSTTRQTHQLKAKSKAKKRRIKTFASSSTRQLQRKKAEKSALLEQSFVLQVQLDLLKRSKHAARTGPNPNRANSETNVGTKSEWYKQAVTQFVRRQQSEKTNQQLRAILANQERTTEALRVILQRRTLLEGMDLVFGRPEPLYRQPCALVNSAGIMNRLEQRVETLYNEAGGLWVGSPICTMNVNHNTQYGKVIEIETVTPISCSIQEASAVLWKDLKTVHEIPDKRYRYVSPSYCFV
ncbi:hypothetical protein PHPALM_30117 [Phytophthora palmivora]|uniref:M96 mating-specific protein family n=1 Tax=Phytophthora palmivora TaxID=4796 RepID=A0A2P4X603_9STRA|nr:hypothetical protein PHPALM_30117 [Phytophthora palmivora]